jgi:hypothetical protein
VNRLIPAFWLLILCSIGIGALSARAGSQVRTAVVMIDKGPAGFVKTLDSRVPRQGLFKALLDLRATGVDRVAILAHEEATFRMVADLDGLLSKAGFSSIRVFYFGKDKDWLHELSYPSVYLFTEDVDSLKRVPASVSGAEKSQ